MGRCRRETGPQNKDRARRNAPEARVIIPGCQALLGFQLVAMLTQAFDELPNDAKK
jgi:hypothetical protein